MFVFQGEGVFPPIHRHPSGHAVMHPWAAITPAPLAVAGCAQPEEYLEIFPGVALEQFIAKLC